jgi:hypothetical protein
MTVSVAPGTAAVPLATGQGSALCKWDAPEVVTIAAAPGSGQSRVDLIVAQVRDPDLDGGQNNDFIITAVTGTPAARGVERVELYGDAPTRPDLKPDDPARPAQRPVGPFAPVAPTPPANALVLYQITVPGAAANLNGATLRDARGRGVDGPGGVLAGGYLALTGDSNVFGQAQTAITGLLLWVNTPPGRRIQVTLTSVAAPNATPTLCRFFILRDGVAVPPTGLVGCGQGTGFYWFTHIVYDQPPPGVHFYSVNALVDGGTAKLYANQHLVVTDIGPSDR